MEAHHETKKARLMKEFEELKHNPRISIAEYDKWIDECVTDDDLKAKLKSKADYLRPDPKTIEVMLDMEKINNNEKKLWQDYGPGMMREMLRQQGYRLN